MVFEGDFSGVGVNYILVDKAIKFTGNNATFKDVSFVISSDNVTIDGFTLSQSNDVSLISVGEANNVIISNNVLNFEAMADVDGYAIFASNVNNLKLIQNTINYVGNTTGNSLNSAVYVEGDDVEEDPSKNITVDGNIFSLKMSSCEINYDNWPDSIVYSDGILFYYCENVEFINNNVDLVYNSFDLGAYAYDTIYAVHVKSVTKMDWVTYDFSILMSDNILIKNNTINALGHNDTYGIYVGADNFEISDNKLNISSEIYHVGGINIAAPSSNGTVINNDVTVNAKEAVYGIYSSQSGAMGPIENMVYESNIVNANAYFACAMQIGECSANVVDNVFVAIGNYSYGICGSIRDYANIKNNTISAEGSNIGSEGTGDPLLSKNSMGITLKGYALIENNTISSSDIGIQVVKGSDEVSIDAIDNYAIVAVDTDDLAIENNSIVFIGKTNGTIQSNGVLVNGIDSLVIRNNTFDLSLVSAHVDWPEIPEGSWNYVRTPYSEGIVIQDSEGAIFDGNAVNVVYNNFTNSGDDTIYAVDLLDSANSVISNNQIEVNSHTYAYGIFIAATNFTVENNAVYAIADGYCAYAINPDSGASGVVRNNTLVASAPDVVYTVYSMMYGDSTGMNIDYIGNKISGQAYYVNAFDLGGANENIINNTIIVLSKYSVAIYSGSKNNTISGNNIVVLASGEGNKTLPYIVNEIEAIKILSADAVISDNYIETTGDYAINLGGTDSTVENTYILTKKSVGANAIINAGSGAVITNITPGLKTILAAVDLYAFYDDGDVYYVCALDENGDPISNVTLSLIFDDGKIINEVTDSKGIAPFYIDRGAGEYDVAVLFNGTDVYAPKTIQGSIYISPRPVEIKSTATTTVLLTAIKSGYYYKITLVDYLGSPVANKTVTVKFNGKSKNYVTNANGVINYKLAASKTGTQKITIAFKDANYTEASKTATIKITKQASKLVVVKQTLKVKAKVKKYAIVLKDNKNKAIKKAKLTLKVKGKTFKATTNNKGKAVFKITNLAKVGSFTAKVKFAGNAYYKACTKSVKIVVKK